MDVMELRRGLLMSMASGGRSIPSCMDIVEFTISEVANTHTIQHNLGKVPSMFLIIPKTEETGNGAYNQYTITGFPMPSGNADYPYKLINNFKLTNGNWDYTAANMGWNADGSSITIYVGNELNIKAREYWVYIFTYA